MFEECSISGGYYHSPISLSVKTKFSVPLSLETAKVKRCDVSIWDVLNEVAYSELWRTMTDYNVENVLPSANFSLMDCHVIWSDFDCCLAAVVQVPYRFQCFNSLPFVHHLFISSSFVSWFLYLISPAVVLSLAVCFLVLWYIVKLPAEQIDFLQC